jgi:hypothetical protein
MRTQCLAHGKRIVSELFAFSGNNAGLATMSTKAMLRLFDSFYTRLSLDV